ncbi:MAG: hypothetical protein QM757_21475 [Paludibaculum sp.]
MPDENILSREVIEIRPTGLEEVIRQNERTKQALAEAAEARRQCVRGRSRRPAGDWSSDRPGRSGWQPPCTPSRDSLRQAYEQIQADRKRFPAEIGTSTGATWLGRRPNRPSPSGCDRPTRTARRSRT